MPILSQHNPEFFMTNLTFLVASWLDLVASWGSLAVCCGCAAEPCWLVAWGGVMPARAAVCVCQDSPAWVTLLSHQAGLGNLSLTLKARVRFSKHVVLIIGARFLEELCSHLNT